MIYNINIRSPWKLLGLNLHEAMFLTPFTPKFANFTTNPIATTSAQELVSSIDCFEWPL